MCPMMNFSGNAPGETKWQSRTAKPARPEIRLTAGKGITGTTIEQLVDQVVKDVKVGHPGQCFQEGSA